MIIDIAVGKAVFSKIGEGSEKFWNEIYNIGEEHSMELQDKGLRTVRQVLEYIEKTNWYKLSIDSENSFTLILAVSEAFLKNIRRKLKLKKNLKKYELEFCKKNSFSTINDIFIDIFINIEISI